MKQYIYYNGTQSSQYRDKVEIQENRDFCVVDIPMFLKGTRTFPCGSGLDHKLNQGDIRSINKMIRDRSGLQEVSPHNLNTTRTKLERLVKSNIKSFYDLKDNIEWALTELGLTNSAMKFLYPTPEDMHMFEKIIYSD